MRTVTPQFEPEIHFQPKPPKIKTKYLQDFYTEFYNWLMKQLYHCEDEALVLEVVFRFFVLKDESWHLHPPVVREIDEEEQEVTSPTHAPVTWPSGRNTNNETPPEFIKRVYADWLGKISRPDIKRLDPALYKALSAWLSTNSSPRDFYLPTASEKVDQTIRQLQERAKTDPLMRKLFDPKVLNNLARAMERRRTSNS